MNKKMFAKITLFLGLIILIVFLNFKFEIVDPHNLNQLSKFNTWIQAWGWLAPLFFVIIYALAVTIFLPNPFFMIVGGLAFGPLWGVGFVAIGFTAGAGLSFIIARYLAKDTVEYWLEKKDIATKFNLWFDEHGYRLLLVTRSIPIIPVNLQNYAYGLTEISFLNYLLLSFIGTVPKIIFLAGISGLLIESGFEILLDEHLIYFSFIIFLTVSIYFVIYKFFWKDGIDLEEYKTLNEK